MTDIQELPKTLTSVCKQFVLASDVYVAIRAYILYIWTPYFLGEASFGSNSGDAMKCEGFQIGDKNIRTHTRDKQIVKK